MVDTQHFVAHELEDAADRFADYGAAQVAHVHLFGDVGRGEVDGDQLLRGVRVGHRFE